MLLTTASAIDIEWEDVFEFPLSFAEEAAEFGISDLDLCLG
jgi:hypothetical protein